MDRTHCSRAARLPSRRRDACPADPDRSLSREALARGPMIVTDAGTADRPRAPPSTSNVHGFPVQANAQATAACASFVRSARRHRQRRVRRPFADSGTERTMVAAVLGIPGFVRRGLQIVVMGWIVTGCDESIRMHARGITESNPVPPTIERACPRRRAARRRTLVAPSA